MVVQQGRRRAVNTQKGGLGNSKAIVSSVKEGEDHSEVHQMDLSKSVENIRSNQYTSISRSPKSDQKSANSNEGSRFSILENQGGADGSEQEERVKALAIPTDRQELFKSKIRPSGSKEDRRKQSNDPVGFNLKVSNPNLLESLKSLKNIGSKSIKAQSKSLGSNTRLKERILNDITNVLEPRPTKLKPS